MESLTFEDQMEVEAEIFEKYGDPYTLLPGMQAITEEEEFRQHD